MDIEIDLNKSVYEQISEVFEKLKKLKEKRERLIKRIEELKRKLEEIKKEHQKKLAVKKEKKEKEWYENLRWFITSDGFLVVAGKDAMTNEILIKRYMEDKDIVLHADIVGSPFGLIKTRGKQISESTIKEAAKFVASYSRAWKEGLYAVEVYWVYPNQVSKKAPSGEYLPRGAFMIYGKKNYLTATLEIAIGIDSEENIIHGVPESVDKYSKKYVVIIPGNKKVDFLVKKIANFLEVKDKESLEEIKRWIPYGVGEIKDLRLGSVVRFKNQI